MPDHDLRIRAATADDLTRIAAIHLAAYSKEHFTSRLPLEVLTDYYGRFLNGGAETIVLDEPRSSSPSGPIHITGFAVFGERIGEKITAFKRERRGAILKTSLANPVAAGTKVTQRIINMLRASKPVPPSEFLLLSIAVDRAGTGAGKMLLDAFLARGKEKGARTAGLYVNASNIRAINRYVEKGFRFRDLQGDQFYMESSLA